jgi:hypothetical protein
MLSCRSTGFAALVATALIAGPAAAKDFCTAGVPGCSDSGGVQEALNAAAADMATPGAGPDRVLIGSGTWIGNFKLAADVTVEGVGPDTVLTQSDYGSAFGFASVLSVSSWNAVVRNLRIKLPAGNQPRGLTLGAGAKAENVSIDGEGATNAIGVLLTNGARFSGTVDLPSGNNIGADLLTNTTVEDADIAGSPALYAQDSATVRRTRLVGHGGTVVKAVSGALKVQDSLIDAREPGAGNGLTTSAPSGGQLHTVDLRNVTILGHGEDPGAIGIDADASPANDTLTITARDSVIANFGSNALQRIGPGTANLTLDHVNVFPAAAARENGPGTFTATDVANVDPAFGPDGFTPTAASPLLDAGAPGALDPDESPTDLLGNPRIVASGCGDARRDLGAVELPGSCVPPAPPTPQPAVDTVAPAVTKLRLVHRRSVRFTMSEAARVTVRIKRAHHKAIVVKHTVAAGQIKLKLKHALRRGRYAIRVTAVDAAGNRGIRAAKVKAA